MKVDIKDIPGLISVTAKKYLDPRGSFSEIYNKKILAEAGVNADFVQDNISVSLKIYTVRGLHYQAPPFAQAKLVSVQRGRILDVAVDLRRGPTFGHHIAVELSGERGDQLFIPVGFAHGFCTLEPDTVVMYKVDNYYSIGHERGLHWQSPAAGIDWPCGPDLALLSAKDAVLPADIDSAAFG